LNCKWKKRSETLLKHFGHLYSIIRLLKYSQRTGGETLQDRFNYKDFHEELLNKGLDREKLSLYIYRVASDHYILNPTIIRIYNEEMIKILGDKLRINIDKYSLKKL